eukprot:Skav234530  [mRNA]  locus=scaffold2556:149566:151429:- [translate_table: standard]
MGVARRSSWLLRASAIVLVLALGHLSLSFCGSTQIHRHFLFGERLQRNQPDQPDLQSATSRHALEGVDFADVAGATSLLTSFSDQAGNINGVLFQASLPAYLVFLYFLNYKKNNTPPLVFFGFAFLLAFVLLTIPAGIISKGTFSVILADSDWLHGSAESLLTCTNILIVLGFRGALTGDKNLADNSTARGIAAFWIIAVIATLAVGVSLGFGPHTPFLAGLGAMDFPQEPVNALSIPTWIVHWSTVFEFLLAMSLAWTYADAVGNPKWKGLTWGMFPSSISSVFALTFHVFYNQIPWILTGQAVCTFVGNCTLALATYRIASSNGWTLSELDPRPAFARLMGSEEAEEAEVDTFDIKKVSKVELMSGPLLILEVILLTFAFAYGTKYGELMFGASVFQSPDSDLAAVAVVLLPVLLVAYTIYSQSPDLQSGRLPALTPASASRRNRKERVFLAFVLHFLGFLF